MNNPLRFSIRNVLSWVVILALSLTVVMQSMQHRRETIRSENELRELQRQLQAAQQALHKLPVEDPQRAYVLAMPSFTYARWVWRVYLPPGSRYALHIDVGPVNDRTAIPTISPVKGHSQQMGYQGQGETTIIVEQLTGNNRQLLGVSLGGHQEAVCPITPEVARCLSQRREYLERQLGSGGKVSFSKDKRLDLLQRWYPQGAPTPQEPDAKQPVGFSVQLEPM